MKLEEMNLPETYTFPVNITVKTKEWFEWFQYGLGREPNDRYELQDDMNESLLPQIMGCIKGVPVDSMKMHGADKPIIIKEDGI